MDSHNHMYKYSFTLGLSLGQRYIENGEHCLVKSHSHGYTVHC